MLMSNGINPFLFSEIEDISRNNFAVFLLASVSLLGNIYIKWSMNQMKVLAILSNQTHLWSTEIACGEHGNFRFKLEENQYSVIYTANEGVRCVVIKETVILTR